MTASLGPAPEGVVTSSVSAGDTHTCGVRTDATVVCWGDNSYGRASPPLTITVSH